MKKYDKPEEYIRRLEESNEDLRKEIGLKDCFINYQDRMNKLIELLNDYEKRKGEEYGRGNYVWGIDKENKNIFASRFPDGAYICEEESRAIIICKGYEFIKWLVDNDKIDFNDKVKGWDLMLGMPNKRDYIIMYLSISDNPIDDLCSFLK